MYKFFMIILIIILSIISCTTKVETPEEDSMFLRILIGDKYGFMNEYKGFPLPEQALFSVSLPSAHSVPLLSLRDRKSVV